MKPCRLLHLVGITFLLFISCKSTKSATGGKVRDSNRSNVVALYNALASEASFKWITGKAKIKAATPEMRVSGSMQLRMVRDSIVWAMVEKFGFEVSRVLITPDSIFVVDRLNKEYTQESLQHYLSEYGVQLSFKDLQRTLLGKMIALVPDQLDYSRESDFDVLAVRDNAGVNARHWIALSNPPRLVKSQFVDSRGRSLNIENAEWQPFRGTEIPYFRKLILNDGEDETEIEMSFTELTVDEPASIPFSIPSNYDRAR